MLSFVAKGVITIAASFLYGGAAAPASLPTDSLWMNQRGSTLHVYVDTSGQVIGTYINRAPGFPHCANSPYRVRGWTLPGTNTVAFTVMWSNGQENCQSLTSWTGFLSPDGTTLTTLWQLVQNGTTSTSQIIQGQDVFTRVAQKTSTSLKKNGN